MWEEKNNIYLSIRVLHSIDCNILKVKAVTEYIVPTFLRYRSYIIYTPIDLILFYWFILLIDTLFYLDLSRYHFPEITHTYYHHIIYTLLSNFIWSIIIIFGNTSIWIGIISSGLLKYLFLTELAMCFCVHIF